MQEESMRAKILLLGPVVLMMSTAFAQSVDQPFAKIVPSAVIEYRDAPTQAELEMETQFVVLGTGNPIPDAYKVAVTEIEAGVVFTKDDLVIEAFDVPHGEVKPAFGYRITTDDKTIVISGDTAISEELLEKSRGVDLLFHEVISDSGLAGNTEFWQRYHKSYHTLASELGRLASEAQPGLLVLYHGLFYGVPEAVVVDEVKANYDGKVVLANDLDVF